MRKCCDINQIRKGFDMPLVADTQTRVYRCTSSGCNDRILEKTRERVSFFAQHPDRIGERLEQLDREWDIERLLETNASSFVLMFTLLGWLVSSWFFILPGLIGFFLLLHAIQGWCPPLPIFRRIGIRTSAEIDRERVALRVLRGDFAGLCENSGEADPERTLKVLNTIAGKQ